MIESSIKVGTLPLWLAELGVTHDGGRDWFCSANDTYGAAHGAAMRVSFERLGVAAYLSVEGAPLAVFVKRDCFDAAEIRAVRTALWNQGLASVLVVRLPTEIRIYSVALVPDSTESADTDVALVERLDLTARALEVSQLVPRILSGRLFDEYRDQFGTDQRVDNLLLENLRHTRKKLLIAHLQSGAAQALVLQTIFLGYLEDRSIIGGDYFKQGTGDSSLDSLEKLLTDGTTAAFYALFQKLSEDFNGDVFAAPCAFDPQNDVPELTGEHLSVLAEFRSGRHGMESGQYTLWPYDFKFIPVELISAIYNRFLGDDPEQRRKLGAYYTPSFLADLALDQAWERLSAEKRSEGKFHVLDPACGSGIFLVRALQRMLEDWHLQNEEQSAPSWTVLKSFLSRIHGWDLEPNAVRIAVFALYVGVIEQAEPRELTALLDKGRLLPPIFGKTLLVRDFFAAPCARSRHDFDLIVGNPPWVSRKGEESSASTWCKDAELPIPANEIAWAFVWKSLTHLEERGIVAFLLPAMGILLNHQAASVGARRELLTKTRLLRVINLADSSFLLFDGASRPTALCIFQQPHVSQTDYQFDYWCPKATRLLPAGRILTLGSSDKMTVRASTFDSDPRSWRRFMWTRARDRQLLDYLKDMPSLGHRAVGLRDYKRNMSQHESKGATWVIGQGLQPFADGQPRDISLDVSALADPLQQAIYRIPHLDIRKFRPWAFGTSTADPWPHERLRRNGFMHGFHGARVLVPQGVERAVGRVRAAYTDQSLSFRDSLQAIWSPYADDQNDLKLLTAILNSRLAAWFYFHETANFGADRAKVDESQLLLLPFPAPIDLPNPEKAADIKTGIISAIDTYHSRVASGTASASTESSLCKTLDSMVYDYFGLSFEDQIVIEDTFDYVIPSMQPRADSNVPLWHSASARVKTAYKELLVRELSSRMREGNTVDARVLDGHPDVTVVELYLSSGDQRRVSWSIAPNLDSVLTRILRALPHNISRNIELIPDLLFFEGRSAYLIKPSATRYWIGTSALADADRIALDAERLNG